LLLEVEIFSNCILNQGVERHVEMMFVRDYKHTELELYNGTPCISQYALSFFQCRYPRNTYKQHIANVHCILFPSDSQNSPILLGQILYNFCIGLLIPCQEGCLTALMELKLEASQRSWKLGRRTTWCFLLWEQGCIQVGAGRFWRVCIENDHVGTVGQE
jgi:hypothetical protein